MLHRGARVGDRVRRRAGFHRTATGRALARPSARRRRRTPRSLARFRSRGSARSAGFRRSRARSATCWCAGRSSRRTAATPTCRARCTRFRIENRGAAARTIDVTLEGTLGHRQLRVRTPRPFEDADRVSRARIGRGAARGIVAAGSRRARDARRRARLTSRSTARQYAIRRAITIARGCTRAGRVLSRRRTGARRRRGDGRRPAAPRLARAARVDARRAAELEQSTGQRGDRPPDQSQSVVRVLLRASAARSTTRSTISCARARRGMATA